MKTQTTRKALYNNYGKSRVIALGYCTIQNIAKYWVPRFYTRGVYGWNADVLTFEGFAICTGYRTCGTFSPKISAICAKWDAKLSKATTDTAPAMLEAFAEEVRKALAE